MGFKDTIDAMPSADVLPVAAPAQKVEVAEAGDFRPAAIKAIVDQMRQGQTNDAIHAWANTKTRVDAAGLAAFVPSGWQPVQTLNVVKKSHIRRIRRLWEERMAALAPQEP